jgi:hypothetical protein
MKRSCLIVAALALLPACTVGPSTATFRPAHQPAGIEAKLTVGNRAPITSELLEVQPTALLVRNGREVILVPLAAIRSASFPQAFVMFDGRNPFDADSRERLRLLSRYPQGLSPELLKSLLQAYGQADLIVWDS